MAFLASGASGALRGRNPALPIWLQLLVRSRGKKKARRGNMLRARGLKPTLTLTSWFMLPYSIGKNLLFRFFFRKVHLVLRRNDDVVPRRWDMLLCAFLSFWNPVYSATFRISNLLEGLWMAEYLGVVYVADSTAHRVPGYVLRGGTRIVGRLSIRSWRPRESRIFLPYSSRGKSRSIALASLEWNGLTQALLSFFRP